MQASEVIDMTVDPAYLTKLAKGSVAARVAHGAAFLDEHRPGWHTAIDLEQLSLETCTDCILAQLHDGLYSHALRTIWRAGQSGWHWDPDAAVGQRHTQWHIGWADVDRYCRALGFTAVKETRAEWKALDQAWVNAVKNRFETGDAT